MDRHQRVRGARLQDGVQERKHSRVPGHFPIQGSNGVQGEGVGDRTCTDGTHDVGNKRGS